MAVRAGVGRVTVPQIFINEKLIGGCSDIQALGQFKLAELLAWLNFGEVILDFGGVDL